MPAHFASLFLFAPVFPKQDAQDESRHIILCILAICWRRVGERRMKVETLCQREAVSRL